MRVSPLILGWSLHVLVAHSLEVLGSWDDAFTSEGRESKAELTLIQDLEYNDDSSLQSSLAECLPNTNQQTRNRRRGRKKSCPIPLRPGSTANEEPHRQPLTKDPERQPLRYNDEICPSYLHYDPRSYLVCDSGLGHDREYDIYTQTVTLYNCNPCAYVHCQLKYSDKACVDHILDICMFPHRVWCCGELDYEIMVSGNGVNRGKLITNVFDSLSREGPAGRGISVGEQKQTYQFLRLDELKISAFDLRTQAVLTFEILIHNRCLTSQSCLEKDLHSQYLDSYVDFQDPEAPRFRPIIYLSNAHVHITSRFRYV